MESTLEAETLVSMGNLTQYKLVIGDDKTTAFVGVTSFKETGSVAKFEL